MASKGQKIFLLGVALTMAITLAYLLLRLSLPNPPYYIQEPVTYSLIEHDNDTTHEREIFKDFPIISTITKLQNINSNTREAYTQKLVTQTEAEIQDCSYDGSGDYSCYDIVPRTAYYDNRIVSGKPHHTIYVLAQMRDTVEAAHSVTACEVNGHKYSNIQTKKDSTWWVQKYYPGDYPYCAYYIKCHDVPPESVQNGNIVKVIYRKNGTLFRVTAEKPLVLTNPAGPSDITKGKGSVVVCVIVFDHPPYFNEWLKYQKTIGVKKIHMSAEESFAVNATSTYPLLEEALASGYAEMEVWKKYPISDKVFYHSQDLKYVDCSMKYTGIYEYGFFYDLDDFFNPMIPDQKDIHYYVNQFFNSNSIASVRIPWFRYYCRPKKELYHNRTDGNITDTLTSYEGLIENTKAIHRLNGVEFVHVHEPLVTFPDFRTVYVEEKLAYFAHIRPMKDC